MAACEELRDQLRELQRSLKALPAVSEPPKPILRVLGSMQSERKWNALLAYFLDPSEPHGFDADLLKGVLDTIADQTNQEFVYFHRDIKWVSVETEVTSPQNNRLDIVIRVPGRWFVCIESKVDAPEEKGKPQRYINDDHLGDEEKADYPEDGHHYVFLSKQSAPDTTAKGFGDLYWEQVVDACQEQLRYSHGRYPDRSVGQLNDFLSTIITVTNMGDDKFTQTQKEKVRLLAEYKAEIDQLIDATNQVREQATDEWPERFRKQVDNELWTEEWHARNSKWGTIHRDGWYLDGELNPTQDVSETKGNDGVRLHFMHYIREPDSFLDGELKYELVCNTRVPVRKEFYRLYNSDRWQEKLEPIADGNGIEIQSNKSTYTHKTYDVEQSRLPENYFEMLAIAFEEHLPLVEFINEILQEAVSNVKKQ